MSTTVMMGGLLLSALDPLLEDQLGRLLVAVVVLGVIVLVGRMVLKIAWKLLVLAGLVIAVLYIGSITYEAVAALEF